MILGLWRCAQLGVPYLVLHPGAHMGQGVRTGIKRIVRSLDTVHKRTQGINVQILLETTAGQGSNLGWRFEHLATILDGVKDPDRLGVCFDTCHVFAAGYAMGTEQEYKATMKAFNATVGVKQIKAFHLNDSKKPLGSRVDRHNHIGRGEMGIEPFRHLLNDRRFRKVPMYLETPKGEHGRTTWDKVNLRTLRGLVES